jgi:Cd2+/Zn2+-exporting ATPase
MNLTPDTARYYCSCSNEFIEKPVAEIQTDACVMVRPGERVPLDGTLSKGETTVNQAPITGESMPVTKQIGDTVYAGSINNESTFEFSVTHTAEDTNLAHIIRLIEEAQQNRAPVEQWVEKFARVYTPVMILIALTVAILPPLITTTPWDESFYNALVVLLIACPCALVISTPVTIVAGLAAAARAGGLIKGGRFLEAPAAIRAIALDKTGTLTCGTPEVREIVPLNGHTETQLLAIAASIEALSEHPLAKAILRHAKTKAVSFTPAASYTALKGRGAEAQIDDHKYWLGSHRLLLELGHDTVASRQAAERLEAEGNTVVVLASESACADGKAHVCGLISFADQIRDDTAESIRALKESGISHLVMLTGDNEGTAKGIAKLAGVDEYKAELLPQDKVAAVKKLVDQYQHVAMIGDGINDAPAMATATLGIAMGAIGSDAAIDTADIALMSDDLSRVPWLIRHARRTTTIIKQNIAFALGLKLAVLLLAGLGYATLWLAIVADMGASLAVILNGLRLLREKPTRT